MPAGDIKDKSISLEISTKKSRDFFKEVEKVGGYKHNPPTINGLRESNSIAELLKNKYVRLYNSNPSEQANIKEIKDFIINHVQLSNYKEHIVSE